MLLLLLLLRKLPPVLDSRADFLHCALMKETFFKRCCHERGAVQSGPTRPEATWHCQFGSCARASSPALP